MDFNLALNYKLACSLIHSFNKHNQNMTYTQEHCLFKTFWSHCAYDCNAEEQLYLQYPSFHKQMQHNDTRKRKDFIFLYMHSYLHYFYFFLLL